MKEFFKLEFDSKRIFGLDILRSVSILFVMLRHSSAFLPSNCSLLINVSYAIDSVSMFFILSGFLIGGILLKIIENDNFTIKTVIGFWGRRWFRTLPNYFLILTILITLELLFHKNFLISNVKSYFYFSQNIFQCHPLFFDEAWSLSIEEWFYLLIPFLIFLAITVFRLENKKALIIVGLIVILFSTGFRYYRYRTIYLAHFWDLNLFFRSQVSTRLDSIMYGVYGALLSFYYEKNWLRYKNTLFIVGIIILLLQYFVKLDSKLYLCVFSFSITSLATLFLLPFLSTYTTGKGFTYQIITYISLISYSMYLINMSLIEHWIIDNIELTSLSTTGIFIKYFLFWFLTVFLSLVLYKYYEVPMTKLRDLKVNKN